MLGGRLSVHLLPSAPYSARDPVRSRALGVSLQRQQGVHAIGSDRRTDFDAWPGVLTFTPAGLPVFSESPVGGEYVVARWSGLLPGEPAAGLPGHRTSIEGHRQAWAIGRAIRKLLLQPQVDALAVEEAAVQFIGLCAPWAPVRQRVDRARLARILDRIADEYDQPLTLSRLAGAEGLTEVAFLREFSRVMGTTPHAFIVETRLQAARALIAGTEMPLAQVAPACGFAHQSHLGAAFARSLGMTPHRYRGLCHADSRARTQRRALPVKAR